MTGTEFVTSSTPPPRRGDRRVSFWA